LDSLESISDFLSEDMAVIQYIDNRTKDTFSLNGQFFKTSYNIYFLGFLKDSSQKFNVPITTESNDELFDEDTGNQPSARKKSASIKQVFLKLLPAPKKVFNKQKTKAVLPTYSDLVQIERNYNLDDIASDSTEATVEMSTGSNNEIRTIPQVRIPRSYEDLEKFTLTISSPHSEKSKSVPTSPKKKIDNSDITTLPKKISSSRHDEYVKRSSPEFSTLENNTRNSEEVGVSKKGSVPMLRLRQRRSFSNLKSKLETRIDRVVDGSPTESPKNPRKISLDSGVKFRSNINKNNKNVRQTSPIARRKDSTSSHSSPLFRRASTQPGNHCSKSTRVSPSGWLSAISIHKGITKPKPSPRKINKNNSVSNFNKMIDDDLLYMDEESSIMTEKSTDLMDLLLKDISYYVGLSLVSNDQQHPKELLQKLLLFYDIQGKTVQFWKLIFTREYENSSSLLGGKNQTTENITAQIISQNCTNFLTRAIQPTLTKISSPVSSQSLTDTLIPILSQLFLDFESATRKLSTNSTLYVLVSHIYSLTNSIGSVVNFISNQVLIPAFQNPKQFSLVIPEKTIINIITTGKNNEIIERNCRDIIASFISKISRLCIGEDFDPFTEDLNEFNTILLEAPFQKVYLQSIKNIFINTK